MTLENKLANLQQSLSELDTTAVAFSGGVDSTFLLKMACISLGPQNVLALTARTPFFTSFELKQCRLLAEQIKVPLQFVDIDLLSIKEVRHNTPERCYHCKHLIMSQLLRTAEEANMASLIEGSNRDDLSDYRPGFKAVSELQVRSPLIDAGLSKLEIREASHRMGLPTWNKPALSCLATRIPYGDEIDPQLLPRIERCEDWLRQQGFQQYRVRVDRERARIEISPHQMIKIVDDSVRRELIRFFLKNGFDSVTLDLQGYRSGSMNESLE